MSPTTETRDKAEAEHRQDVPNNQRPRYLTAVTIPAFIIIGTIVVIILTKCLGG